MKKILILSVGSSPDPINNAIRNNKPNHVYFFCSSGSKGSEGIIDKSIVEEVGLDKSQFDIFSVVDPDDFNECYTKISEIANKIEETHGQYGQIIANYTGGTKTMSVAMALVGLMTEKWDLSVNIGPRTDLIKVRGGDVPIIIDKWRIFCQTQIESVRGSIRNFDYAYAVQATTEMLQHPLNKTFRDKVIEARQLCQAFDYWDKFAHNKALNLLALHGHRFSRHVIILKQILGKQRNSTGYELVGDLLNNAERKAHRKYYDDSVGRIYRATELFAQIRLKKHYGYDTSNILLTDLPEDLRREYESRIREDNKLILGLKEDYELLLKLKDPVGRKYDEQKSKIIDALSKRNNSIGAHGLEPLGEGDYRNVKETLHGFIENISKEIAIDIQIPQLPKEGIF